MKFDNIELLILGSNKRHKDIDYNFVKMSKHAHTSHSEIHRRYKKFLSLNKLLGDSINKRRAKKCCNMVKTHLEELKYIRSHMSRTGYDKLHPIFANKINKWINECDVIYNKYKLYISKL